MKLSKIEPFRAVRAFYYVNRPLRYRDNGLKIINGIKFQPIDELSFCEKLKNRIILIKNSILKKIV